MKADEPMAVVWYTAAQAAELLAPTESACSPGWLDALREIGEEGITFAVEPAKRDGTWWLVERPDQAGLLLPHGIEPDHIWTRWAVAGILMNQPTEAGRLPLPQLAFELVSRMGPEPRHPS